MAQIGVKRLGAGYGKENKAERPDAGQAVCGDEANAISGIDRIEHAGIVNDVHDSANPDDEKPHQHDRPE